MLEIIFNVFIATIIIAVIGIAFILGATVYDDNHKE